MPKAFAALTEIERTIKELQLAWNTAEGRRGRIAENRQTLSQQKSEFETQKESLRQEQWRLKKESTTLQHAREEAEALRQQVANLATERDVTRKELREVLRKVKAASVELRP